MKKRIEQLMEEKNLTITSLADEIGVKRPTIAHAMSGRNKPSLDVVTKILERFRDINSDWLLFGKDPMIKSSVPVQQELFSDTVVQNTQSVTKPEEGSNLQPPPPVETGIRSITAIQSTGESQARKTDCDKKVSKILIFFSDNTFETFVPESSKK